MSDTDPSSTDSVSGIELEPDQLSPEALRGVVEEYVTREGTDYGHSDWSLDDKVDQVLHQLEVGEVKIVFDLEQQSASIVTTPDLARYTLQDSNAPNPEAAD